jgi:acyl-CoA reductase-like NAD-dependent aldehyde dehydrogenase
MVTVVNNFVDGEFCLPDDGQYLDSVNPATGQVWAKIADSGQSDVERAVNAANNALLHWTRVPTQTRSQILCRVADLLEERLEEFAVAESRDQGKPVWLARSVDIPRAVHNFRSFATSMLHHCERSTYLDTADALNYTSRDPVGVAVLISPWNLPLYLLTFKMAPALACGNTVVCKPSELTSVTCWMLCQLLQQAGVPRGVVNVVFGSGSRVGNALVAHPRTHLVSFTGSTLTAHQIRLAAAPYCKKLSLELGGKNAAVIFEDADLEKCLETTIRSSFMNQGEICLCTSRLFVDKSIFNSFLQKFVERTRKITVGDPMLDSTWMGALVSRQHRDKVLGYIELAQSEGCQVCCGHGVDGPIDLDESHREGYFIRPTVLTNVSDKSRLMTEEIFGPVVCVVPFDTEHEVVDRVNSVEYGLSATVWSGNVDRIHRVARVLKVGTVWLNCWMVRDLHMPFGGMKSSGIGREGIVDSLEFYTELRTVCLQLSTI